MIRILLMEWFFRNVDILTRYSQYIYIYGPLQMKKKKNRNVTINNNCFFVRHSLINGGPSNFNEKPYFENICFIFKLFSRVLDTRTYMKLLTDILR